MGMMSKDWNGLTKLCDTFFNGRKAADAAEQARVTKPSITVRDLVSRGVSTVRCDGKIYRITVEAVEVTK